MNASSCNVGLSVVCLIVTSNLFSSALLSSNTGLPNALPLQPVATLSSPLFLYCYSNGDSQGIEWKRYPNNGGFIGSCDASYNGYNVTCNNSYTESRLEIRNVSSTELGSRWSCFVTFYNGLTRFSNNVTLYEQTVIDTLSVMDAIDDKPVDNNDLTTIASDTLTLTCETSPAYPDPFIKWYISRDIDNSTGFIELDETNSTTSVRDPNNGTVKLTSTLVYNLTRADNDKQMFCNASNNYSWTSSSRLRLNVQYEANITSFALNETDSPLDGTVYIKRGTSMSFMCEVESNPPARITLSRETITLVNESGYLLIHTEEDVSSTEEGTYTCNASNPVFNTWATEKINVAIGYKANITDFLINGKFYEGNATLNDTESLNVTCAVDSRPTGVVYIISNNSSCQSTQLGQSICEINSPTCERHPGLYTCHANNTFGADSKSVAVFINCIPSIKNLTKEHISLNDNRIVTVSASIIAYPSPDVYWTLPNSSMVLGACNTDTKTNYLSIQVCKLTVNVTSNNVYGTYNLTAYNMRGNTSIHFMIENPSEATITTDAQPVDPKDNVNIALFVGSAAGAVLVISVVVIAILYFLRKGKSDKGRRHEESAVYGSQEMNSTTETYEDNGDSRTAQDDQSNAGAIYAKVDKSKQKVNKGNKNTREVKEKNKPPANLKKPKGGSGAASQHTDELTYIQVDFRPGDKKQKSDHKTTPADMSSTPYADIDYSKQVQPLPDEIDRRVESVRRRVPDPIDQSAPPARPSKPASLSTSVGQRPGKGRGKTEQHSLNYAEVSFSKQPPRPKKSAAVRQEEATPYADIAFNKRGAPLPPDQSDQ